MRRNQEVALYSLVSQTHIKEKRKKQVLELIFFNANLVSIQIVNFFIPILDNAKQILNFIKGELCSRKPLSIFF